MVEAIDTHLVAIDGAIADLVHLRGTLTAAKAAARTAPVAHRPTSQCPIIERMESDISDVI